MEINIVEDARRYTGPDTLAPEEPPVSIYASLDEAKSWVERCTACSLAQTRTNTVFSDGNPNADLMIIGEGPGQTEDETGIPFVGKAGQLLTQILESVGLERQHDVYICNIVKCRPPQNRKPYPHEMLSCSRYLKAQIALVQPKLILLAGATACEGVMQQKVAITKIRGQWLELPNYPGIRFMPIFHPSYLLRNQSREVNSPKWHTWQDMKAVREALSELRLG